MFFIHYKHTQLIVENIHFRRSNCVSFYIGLVAGVGLLLIASFQVNINVFIYVLGVLTPFLQDGATLSAIHYLGAVLLFGLGTVYCFIVTAIGWHVARQNDDRRLKIISLFRIILCVLMLAGSVTGDCG